jgi:hypothetical protein
MGTKYLMGAASATIAKFLWCVVTILEGAHDQRCHGSPYQFWEGCVQE